MPFGESISGAAVVAAFYNVASGVGEGGDVELAVGVVEIVVAAAAHLEDFVHVTAVNAGCKDVAVAIPLFDELRPGLVEVRRRAVGRLRDAPAQGVVN